MNNRENRAYFIAGFTPRKGVFGVASYLHALESRDSAFTRFYMNFEDEWVNQEIMEDIVSVTYTREGDKWSWWLLDKRGKVISLSASGRSDEVIADAGVNSGQFGYLSQITQVGGSLYTVGVGRQVYNRQNSGWIRMDGGIRAYSGNSGFRAIDGFGEDTLHAVGYGGEIWHFDGNTWNGVVSPTNVVLESVCAVSSGLCYVCGANGTVLRGFRDTWESLESNTSQNLWSIKEFQGRIYVASTTGLFTVEGGRLEHLDLGRKFEGRRLYSNGEELWSMEHHEVWVFDGSVWKERICPDNA